MILSEVTADQPMIDSLSPADREWKLCRIKFKELMERICVHLRISACRIGATFNTSLYGKGRDTQGDLTFVSILFLSLPL